jgi:hypothetical protein
MRASKLTDAKKAFLIKQGEPWMTGLDLPQGWGQPGNALQLEETVWRPDAV